MILACFLCMLMLCSLKRDKVQGETGSWLEQQAGDVLNETSWDDDEDGEDEARSGRLFTEQKFESMSYIDVQKQVAYVNMLQEDVNIKARLMGL